VFGWFGGGFDRDSDVARQLQAKDRARIRAPGHFAVVLERASDQFQWNAGVDGMTGEVVVGSEFR
jgi:hypothetical protein